MKVLLDMYIILWALTKDHRFPLKAKEIILQEDKTKFGTVRHRSG